MRQVDAVYSSLDGKQVALRVSSMILTGGDEIPAANAWPHITVVCEKVESCRLAVLCTQGFASHKASGTSVDLKQASGNARARNGSRHSN
jgi:hypothetical protein